MSQFQETGRTEYASLDTGDPDDWMAFSGRNLYHVSLRTQVGGGFHVDASATRLPEGFLVARFKTNAGRACLSRAGRDLHAEDADRYVVWLPLQGEIEISQLRRQHVIGPGLMAMMSTADAAQCIKLGDNDTLYFVLPRDFIDQRIIHAEDHCAQPLETRAGLGQLLRDTLVSLGRSCGSMTPEEQLHSVRMIGHLWCLALEGPSADDGRSLKEGNLARVKRVLHARLSDPELTLSSVARECSMSLRYLHVLFEDEETSAAEYLRNAWLQLARRKLESADPRSCSISSIALSCGFSNAAHFSTAFRRAFSLSPKDVLRGAKGC